MSDAIPILYLGNKNYSSWSLRPWLCLRWAGIEFEERLISLKQEGYGRGEIAEVLDVSPAGKVPALHVGSSKIWDSLAIAEWAAEQEPELWPQDPAVRAEARSVVCEMHSGFPDLRDQLPMNIERRCRASNLRPATYRDIRRVLAVWDTLRSKYAAHGPWLFGRRTIADAFYAPIVTRFRTYGIEVPQSAADYASTLLDDADFRVWEAQPIPERFEFIDEVFGHGGAD